MKCLMKTLVVLAFASIGFAKPSADLDQNEQSKYKTKYIRMGAASLPHTGGYMVAPSGCIGWLYRENNVGIDISSSFSATEKDDRNAIVFTMPKVLCDFFFTPITSLHKKGAYVGVGGSVYGIYTNNWRKDKQKKDVNYTGIAANGSVGYYYNVSNNLQSYAQAGLNMPTPLAFHERGHNRDVYKPSFEFSLGLGF